MLDFVFLSILSRSTEFREDRPETEGEEALFWGLSHLFAIEKGMLLARKGRTDH